MAEFETVIGLEIHVQLNTESKAFCRDANKFGDNPNTNISAVSLALPGTLPMLNEKHVLKAVKLGLALSCEIDKLSRFDRKNYTYPDLPKGYQITQDAKPICNGGQFTFKTEKQSKTIRIHHIHMEEDAGKSIHDINDIYTCLDYNRAGTPLLEVVTEPDFRSGQEVADFMNAFQILLRYLNISDANMEEGSLRCDCNVSVRPLNTSELGTRAEIKNLNSKKFAKQAVIFEAQRQWNLLQEGKEVIQETRLFDPNKGETYSMRKKEDALDYRYFPEPDMQSIRLTNETIESINSEIQYLPWIEYDKLTQNLNVKESLAETITSDIDFVKMFYHLNGLTNDAVLVSKFIVNQYIPNITHINGNNLNETMKACSELLQLIKNEEVSPSQAYSVLLPQIFKNSQIDIRQTAEKESILIQKGEDNKLDEICMSVIQAFPDKAEAFKKGKKGLIGFFMGQIMKGGHKGLNPKNVQSKLEELLNQ